MEREKKGEEEVLRREGGLRLDSMQERHVRAEKGKGSGGRKERQEEVLRIEE